MRALAFCASAFVLTRAAEDSAEHRLEHVRALDVRPVRGARHEPARLRRLRERGERGLGRVDPRERRRVRDDAALHGHRRHVLRARERGDPFGGERLLLARHRDAEDGAAEEGRHVLAPRVARHRVGADLAGVVRVAELRVERIRPLPPVADERADLALGEDEGLLRVRLVAGLVRPREPERHRPPRGQAGERLWRVERADPLAALRLRDLAAEVVDERHRGVPVAAREVDGRVGRVLLAAELSSSACCQPS